MYWNGSLPCAVPLAPTAPLNADVAAKDTDENHPMQYQDLSFVGWMVLFAVFSPSIDAIAQSSEPLRLPLSIIRSNPVTTITVGERTVQAIVDTGGGGITLSEAVIRSAGGVRLADERVWHDAFGREIRVPQFTIPVMTIGGQTFHDVVVMQATESPEDQAPVVPNTIG